MPHLLVVPLCSGQHQGFIQALPHCGWTSLNSVSELIASGATAVPGWSTCRRTERIQNPWAKQIPTDWIWIAIDYQSVGNIHNQIKVLWLRIWLKPVIRNEIHQGINNNNNNTVEFDSHKKVAVALTGWVIIVVFNWLYSVPNNAGANGIKSGALPPKTTRPPDVPGLSTPEWLRTCKLYPL